MKIYAVNTETLKTMQEEMWSEWIRLLDCTRREKIGKQRQKKNRIQSISAGLLLRYSFLQEGYTKDEWEYSKIQYDPSGKPRIVQYPEFCYSLSHSGDWVICGVHSKELGADIQEMRPWKENVAKRFYAIEEYDKIMQAKEAERQALFYQMWTAKESYGKFTGDGIGKGICQYLVDIKAGRITDTECDVYAGIRHYHTLPEYMVCVCAREYDTFPEEIEVISFQELI